MLAHNLHVQYILSLEKNKKLGHDCPRWHVMISIGNMPCFSYFLVMPIDTQWESKCNWIDVWNDRKLNGIIYIQASLSGNNTHPNSFSANLDFKHMVKEWNYINLCPTHWSIITCIIQVNDVFNTCSTTQINRMFRPHFLTMGKQPSHPMREDIII